MTNEETTTRLGSFSYLDDISSTIDFSEILKKHRKENEGPLHPSEKELQVEYQGNPSRERLSKREEFLASSEWGLDAKKRIPIGIPREYEDSLWSKNECYKKLRSMFLVSEKHFVQTGPLRGYLVIRNDRLLHLFTFPYVIHPFSDFYWTWNLIVSIIVAVSLLIEPYLLTFHYPIFFTDEIRLASFLVSFILVLDMILTFSVGTVDVHTTTIHLDPVMIRHEYLGGKFWYDLITRFPIDSLWLLFFTEAELDVESNLTWLRLVTFWLRLFRVEKVYKFIHKLTVSFNMNSWNTQITKHGVIVFFCFHWGACLHWLGPDLVNAYYEEPKPWSWPTFYDLWDEPHWYQYLNCLLRSIGNLLRLDGGAFVPRELEDMFCTAFQIFIAISIVGHLTSMCSSMLIEFQKEDDAYREMIACVKEYLRFRRIPQYLQQRVLAHLDGKYKGQWMTETLVLGSLSDNLRAEMMRHNCKHLVQNVYLFTDIPLPMMMNLVQRLSFEVYIPGDVLLSPHYSTDCIIFIEDGYFGLVNSFGTCIEVLKNGDFFGEVALLCPELPRVTSVVALAVSQVYKLSRNGYQLLMEQFPEIHETIQAVAQKRVELERDLYEKQVSRARKASRWKELILRKQQTVEEYYAEVDSGKIPAYHLSPDKLQLIQFHNYKKKKMEQKQREAAEAAARSKSKTSKWTSAHRFFPDQSSGESGMGSFTSSNVTTSSTSSRDTNRK